MLEKTLISEKGALTNLASFYASLTMTGIEMAASLTDPQFKIFLSENIKQ